MSANQMKLLDICKYRGHKVDFINFHHSLKIAE